MKLKMDLEHDKFIPKRTFEFMIRDGSLGGSLSYDVGASKPLSCFSLVSTILKIPHGYLAGPRRLDRSADYLA